MRREKQDEEETKNIEKQKENRRNKQQILKIPNLKSARIKMGNNNTIMNKIIKNNKGPVRGWRERAT